VSSRHSCSSTVKAFSMMARRLMKVEAGYWPDVVGQMWYEAETRIRKQFPNITIQVMRQGTYVQKDFSPDRVQIFIDGEGKVVKAPSIGWYGDEGSSSTTSTSADSNHQSNHQHLYNSPVDNKQESNLTPEGLIWNLPKSSCWLGTCLLVSHHADLEPA